MVQHQPGHRFGFLGGQPERRADLQRQFRAELGMVAAAALGDVVQQHRHIQRAARLQVVRPARWRPARFRASSPRSSVLSTRDRLDGVLVDGEHVVGVELHLADDARPVRQTAAEDAGLVHHLQPARAVGCASSLVVARRTAGRGTIAAASGSPRSSHRAAFVADQRAHGQRMQLQPAVARDLQDAQHLDRLGVELAALGAQQHAVGQHEAGVEQRGVGLLARCAGGPRAARSSAGSSTWVSRVTSRAVRK